MGEITQKFVLPETFQGVRDELAGQIGMMWELIKAPLIVPLLRLGVYICLAMSLMLFCERLYMGIVIILVKLFWKKPEKRYKYETIQEDVEMGSSNFPVVLIQIPMYNEREVRFLFFFLFSLSLSVFTLDLLTVFAGFFCDLLLGFSFSGFLRNL
jgi:beta-mannan synthase